jgi:hypothetical protein
MLADIDSKLAKIDEVDEKEEVAARALNDLNTRVNDKQPTLVSGTNIKTINNESILGSGNITIQGGGSSYTAGDGIDIKSGDRLHHTGIAACFIDIEIDNGARVTAEYYLVFRFCRVSHRDIHHVGVFFCPTPGIFTVAIIVDALKGHLCSYTRVLHHIGFAPMT